MLGVGPSKNPVCQDLVCFFECFGPRARYMVWHTKFMCLQSFPNFIWWTPAAFSGIFAHRSKTVTLGECKCLYLGTALPSFLAQNRKNEGFIQPHITAALAEVWQALSHLCRNHSCLQTPHPCPEQQQHPAPYEPSKDLSILMVMSFSQPLVQTASLQQLCTPTMSTLTLVEAECHQPALPVCKKEDLAKSQVWVRLRKGEQRGL